MMKEKEEIPLTEPTLFILLSLALEPRHGYGIMKDVEELSDGRVSLSTGTLYGALRRLVKDGWIQRLPPEKAEGRADGRNQKYYQLSTNGERLLHAELNRLQAVLSMAENRKLGWQS